MSCIRFDSFGKYYYNSDHYLHRLDGPAVVFDNGVKIWWINGIRLSIDKEKLLNIWYEKNHELY